jgi:hypothetical protein
MWSGVHQKTALSLSQSSPAVMWGCRAEMLALKDPLPVGCRVLLVIRRSGVELENAHTKHMARLCKRRMLSAFVFIY